MSSDHSSYTPIGALLGGALAYALDGDGIATAGFAVGGGLLGFAATKLAEEPSTDATLKTSASFATAKNSLDKTSGSYPGIGFALPSGPAQHTAVWAVAGGLFAFALDGDPSTIVAYTAGMGLLGFAAVLMTSEQGVDPVDALINTVNHCFAEAKRWRDETFGATYFPSFNRCCEIGAVALLSFWALRMGNTDCFDATVLSTGITGIFILCRGEEQSPRSWWSTLSDATTFLSQKVAPSPPLTSQEKEMFKEAVQHLGYIDAAPQPTGIQNSGNDCFLNAAFQMMIHCPPLLEATLGGFAEAEEESEDQRFLVRFINNLYLYHQPNETIPSSKWARASLGFNPWEQSDAAEALRKISDLFDTKPLEWEFEFQRIFDITSPLSPSTNTKTDASPATVDPENPERATRNDPEPPSWLPTIELVDGCTITLQEALDKWLAPNKEKHESMKFSLKDEGVVSAPCIEEQLLVKQMQDTFFCEFKVRGATGQKRSPVTAESDRVHINGQPFQLNGFIVHTGNGYGGHYVAYSRTASGWYYFSDTTVTMKSEEEVLNAFSGASVAHFSKVHVHEGSRFLQGALHP